ncbi:MAG: glycoside hydrolase family 125 protein [Muribaculaceae bacterium]|nr:glycoside hydrolase family 125 protein [Muribaculaceae bacterium]
MNKKSITLCALAAGWLWLCAMPQGQVQTDFTQEAATPVDHRVLPSERLFVSQAVEREIARVERLLKNKKLAQMFAKCFPNTLDTTVHFCIDEQGRPDAFVYTGDIHAMWLRDSGAQVWPYVRLSCDDEQLRQLIAGVINRQLRCIVLDPYANAFNNGPTGSYWSSDLTTMIPELHERKYEIDSLCYPLRLAYEYWLTTGDTSVFGATWLTAVERILEVFTAQQQKHDRGPYRFQRTTAVGTDTRSNGGYGNPVRPVGLIASAFRPSDDATIFQFLIPSNFMAVTSLRKAAHILTQVNHAQGLANDCTALADEVEQALRQHAVVHHPKYGDIYAYEIDGYGSQNLMDDANVPSLLAMPYLGDVAMDDPVYQNTRRFVLSDDNPYFFRGTAGEGIGGPHVGKDMIWPMSIMMRAFTSHDEAEIRQCLLTLLNTDAGTGYMHESFHKDDPNNYTRRWFAWQNTLFGELVLKLIADGRLELLNSL